MKKNYLFVISLFLLHIGALKAQTLTAGDIVVIGYASDTGIPTSTDEFSWLPLIDLQPGTTLYFTDAGYNTIDGHFMGSGQTEEILLRYSVPAAGVVAGTIHTVIQGNLGADYTAFSNTQFGGDADGLISIANAGDQILIFQSTDDLANPSVFGTTNLTPLFMVTGSSVSFDALTVSTSEITPSAEIDNFTNLPPGLTNAVNAVAVGTGPSPSDESDNARYNGITTGTRDEIAFAVSQASNWVRYDAAFGNDLESGTVANGWTSNSVSQFTIVPLSVPEQNLETAFVVTPNPSKGVLQIQNRFKIAIQKIDVFTLSGQLLKSYPTFTENLDLSGLSAGSYFLKIQSENANVVKKIILE